MESRSTHTKLIESAVHGFGCDSEEAGDGVQVLGADGQYPAVEVLAQPLDHVEQRPQNLVLGAISGPELGKVDGHLGPFHLVLDIRQGRVSPW